MNTLRIATDALAAKNWPQPETSPVVLTEISHQVSGFSDYSNHRAIWEIRNDGAGLHGFVAIHNTTLGAALGGCRMVPYESRNAAITDALRLSRGMTAKAALAGFPLGGGKTVIIGNPATDKTEALFNALGTAIERIGNYYTGEDVGTSVRDMDWVADQTSHVIGTSETGGNPADMTALGVCESIRACVGHKFGAGTLTGKTVAVQGLGHVGYLLCEILARDGVKLVVPDIDPDRARRVAGEFGATVVPPGEIHCAPSDVFAPCALGGVLNDQSIPELTCAIVAGSANNQLARKEHGEALRQRGILFAPDYVANSGGLISVGLCLSGEDPKGEMVVDKIRGIAATLGTIFKQADARAVAPDIIAEELVAQRIDNGMAARRKTTL